MKRQRTYRVKNITDEYIYVKRYWFSKTESFMYCPYTYNDIVNNRIKIGDIVCIRPYVGVNEGYFSVKNISQSM